MLNIEQIQNILPQRYPFLMIDRVIELETAKKVVAVKNVTVNDGFFEGHFPGEPIMPGVLIIEAMAQAAIILFYKHDNSSPRPIGGPGAPLSAGKSHYYLGSVKMRFLHPVVPGDQLRVTIEPIKVVAGGALVNATACVGDKEVARGELGFSLKDA